MTAARPRPRPTVRRQLARIPASRRWRRQLHARAGRSRSRRAVLRRRVGPRQHAARSSTGPPRRAASPDVDIDGLQALRIASADPAVVVAVIDDGVDFSHPDLAAHAWTNPARPGRKATNGIDDDGNGYVDDVHGWDFCNNDNTLHDRTSTATAPTSPARSRRRSNGNGVVGVAPESGSWRSSSSTTAACAARTRWRSRRSTTRRRSACRSINASWGGLVAELGASMRAIANSGRCSWPRRATSGENIDAQARALLPGRVRPSPTS